MDSISLSLPPSLSGKDEAGLDSLSLTLSQAGIEKEKDLLGPAYDEKDLLKEFAGHTLLDFFYSRTQEERIDMRKKIREADPGASGEEIKVIYRAAMKDAALKAWNRKKQDEKDSSRCVLKIARHDGAPCHLCWI